MIVEAQVGPRVVQDGSENIVRSEKTGAVCVTDTHGKYQEAVYRGNVFFAASQAAVTFSVGLTTTTAVGLVLSNPPGNTKLVVPLQVEYINTGTIVGVTGLSISPYSSTAVVHTTTLSIRNAYVGQGPSATANADQGATLPAAAVAWKFLYSVLSTNTAVFSPITVYDLGGSLILGPGTACAVLATAAVTGFAGITWEEIPI